AWSCPSTSYWSRPKRMRSDETDATKSSWLPFIGPDWRGAVLVAAPSPTGAGGSSAGGFFEQAARAMTALAINRGRDSFIGGLLRLCHAPFARRFMVRIDRYAVKTI